MKGQINTVFLIATNDISALKGKDSRYHYFYKIVNNINNNYYYGIHTTDDVDDNYKGSGSRLHNAYKKYGLHNFTKYVLQFFDSRKELLKYEKEIVTPDLCNEETCYNIVTGGNGRESLLISVRDINNNWVQLTRAEYANNHTKYVHHSKGRIVLNNGIIHKYVLPKELDKYLSEGWTKGNCNINPVTNNGKIVINKDGSNKFIKPENLDRYLSEGWTKGKIKKQKV